MHLPHLRSARLSKRLIMIVVGITVFTAVIAYVLWSKQTWAQYTPAYTQWQQGIKTDIKAATALPVTNSKEQEVLLSQLEHISERIASEQKHLCSVSTWVEWQRQYVTSYDEAQIACQKKMTDIATFQSQLDMTITYVEDEQKIAKIMAAVTPPGELGDDNWEKQVAAWDKAAMETNTLSVSDVFKPTQQQTVEKMTTVKAAWQELIAAHQQKDKAKFLAAQDKLGASYDGLYTIVADSEKRLRNLTDTLSSAHVKSFN